MSTHHNTTWRDWQEKAAYLDGCAQLESTCAPVMQLARMFAPIQPIHGKVMAIYTWVRDQIRYVRDPILADGKRHEEFADCPTILARRSDDCDGKARLFCAICRACGIPARVRPVVRQLGNGIESFEHVQAEVYLPEFAHPSRRQDGWLPVELILADVPLGYGCERARRGPDGQYVYT